MSDFWGSNAADGQHGDDQTYRAPGEPARAVRTERSDLTAVSLKIRNVIFWLAFIFLSIPSVAAHRTVVAELGSSGFLGNLATWSLGVGPIVAAAMIALGATRRLVNSAGGVFLSLTLILDLVLRPLLGLLIDSNSLNFGQWGWWAPRICGAVSNALLVAAWLTTQWPERAVSDVRRQSRHHGAVIAATTTLVIWLLLLTVQRGITPPPLVYDAWNTLSAEALTLLPVLLAVAVIRRTARN
jgi:hypothetical protein